MKYDRNGKVLALVSEKELTRRRAAAQEKLRENNIDCVLLYGSNLRQGGGTRYFVDQWTGGTNAYFAILPAEGGIALFGHSAKGGKAFPDSIAGETDLNFGYPYAVSCGFTFPYFMEAVTNYCKKKGFKRVGLYRPGLLPYAFVKTVAEANDGVELVDVDDIIDLLQAVKSEEEVEIMKYVAQVHDDIFYTMRALVKPGQREKDLRNEIAFICNKMDCEHLNIMIGSDSKNPRGGYDSLQNRVIQDNDYVNILLEISIVGGHWGELGRTFCLGEPHPRMVQLNDWVDEIQAICADAACPGVPASRILELCNAFQKERNCELETRFFAHGQGMDLTQRPMCMLEESMILEENMFLAIHPYMYDGEYRAFNCDNYLVQKNGSVRLNKYPFGLIVLN